MTVEKRLERKLREGMKRSGGVALKFIPFAFTGFPDRMCLAPMGKIGFVELKSTGKKPTPRQALVINWLRKMGFRVWIIDRQELLDQFFNEF